MTLEDVVAAAIRWPEVGTRLKNVLKSDLISPDTQRREICTFLSDFIDDHGSLPKEGDWQAWVESLPDRHRDSVRRELRRLMDRDLSEFTPEFVVRHAADQLRKAAGRSAISHLTNAEQPGDALLELAEEVKRIGTSANIANQSWEEPIPLGPPEPDPLPVDTLPEWVRGYVSSVADSVQVPSDLPFVLALSALSTAVANKARIAVRPGHREPVHVWTAAILPPGARKSPVFKKTIGPVRDFEDQRVQEIRPERDRVEDRRDVIEGLLKQAKKDARDAETEGGVEEAFADVEDYRERLEAIEVPAVPRLIVSDVTSEKLAQLMADNGGRIAVLSPEGDIFKIMAGRYRSGRPAFDHYKQAWTGDEPIRDDRVGRDGSRVRRPALTMGLTAQPSVLEALQNKRVFRGEGLLARFLYVVPDARIGERKTGADVPNLDMTAQARYRTNLTGLLHARPADVDDKGEYEPHDLELSDGAREVLFEFEGEVEREMGPGGRLEMIADWGAKLPGQVTRIAGLLTFAGRTAGTERPWTGPIPASRMEDAVCIGRALIPHARYALLDVVETDPDLRLARYVLDRLREFDPDAEFTARDLFERVKGKRGLGEMNSLERILSRLEGHGWIRLVDRPSTGGRPPSPRVLVHPNVAGSVRTIRKSVGDGTSATSANQSRANEEV